MKNALRLIFAGVLALAALSFASAQDTTVYQLLTPGLSQISASPGARTLRPTYAAAVSLNPMAGIVHQIMGVAATSATCTVSTASAGGFGQLLIVICSDTGGVTYTFNSATFKPTATVNPTTGKTITVAFVSDGAFWREFARSASAQ